MPPRKPLSLFELVPDAVVLAGLEPEEVGLLILQVLASADEGSRGQLHRGNFISTTSTIKPYPNEHWKAIELALAEGWSWLMRESLLVTHPSQGGEWVVVSRRGKALADSGDLGAYRQAHLLPRDLLHPRLIEAGVLSSFIRGDYDTAVFKSYRAIEVKVREAINAQPDEVGVALIRRAFNPATGPLRAREVPEAEREAMAHLMAGAVGLFKNPQSHRQVGLTNAVEVAEIVRFASYLLRVLDRTPVTFE